MKLKQFRTNFVINPKFFAIVAAIIVQMVITSQLSAATYYVATNGDNLNAGNSSSPFLTIQKGLSVLYPGDTLIIRDGTYSGSTNRISNLPNGTSDKYITIMAENEGNVVLTGGLSMSGSNSYIQFQGLRFHSASNKWIEGNHIKFFRNEFKGGPSSGNEESTTIGTIDYNTTADILLEDNWFHGSGGRYNILVFNASRVVIRRAIIRHDGGWRDSSNPGGLPEAGLAFYDCWDSHAQNVIVLDSNLNYDYWYGAFYNLENYGKNANNSFTGCIALNNNGVGWYNDHNPKNTKWTDVIAWDCRNGGIVLGDKNASIDGATIGMSKLTFSGDWGGGIANFGGGGSAKNLIVYNLKKDIEGISTSYFDTYGNSQTSSGTGKQTYNPLRNGLNYLTFVENGSPLSQDGEGSEELGARITNRIGVPGTFYGESGWDEKIDTTLWPWPFESRIKKEMCVDSGVSRGFCSSSITNYLYSYLGNTYDADGIDPTTMQPPANLRIISGE